VKWLAIAAALAACTATPAPRPVPPPPLPRLVVLLVIDQWPEWAFDVKRPELHGGGFDRLLSEGAWHTGIHPSAATMTAPGHALLGTGEPPDHSGILANGWWHRDLGMLLAATEAPDGATTDQWLLVPGLGDSVAAAHSGAKAVSISLKDRAAILMLGHAGLRIFYDAKLAAWRTLPAQPPAWLDAWNRDHPISAHLHDVWTADDPALLARLSGGPDNGSGEVGEKDFGVVFPHDPQTTPRPAAAIFAMPLGNDLILDTALAAIDGEQLGSDATPDLLALSLSAHDYIGHGWGQESWEMWDSELRLDRKLGEFMTALDAKVGKGQWAMIVTSDHGTSPLPERLEHGGGRITYERIAAAANRAAIAELGAGDWIASARYPSVYLSAAALAQPQHDRDQAIKKIVFALRSFPGIARVEKTADVAGHCETRTGDDFALCIALHPVRSGEIVYLPAPGWIIHADDEPEATAHGSLQMYDREVPVIMLEPGRTPHAPLTAHDDTVIFMPHVAAVLARWLGVTPPTNLPRAAP
jgi:hypothetical protein